MICLPFFLFFYWNWRYIKKYTGEYTYVVESTLYGYKISDVTSDQICSAYVATEAWYQKIVDFLNLIYI